MKDLIKKQEEKFNEIAMNDSGRWLKFDKEEISDLFSKVRKETAEYVCDEIKKRLQPRISKKHAINTGSDAGFGYTAGYNDRIKEEKEIKKDILKELL